MPIATFNTIFFWVFVLTNVVFGILFVWKTSARYKAASAKKTMIIKAVVSLLTWLIANFVVIAVSLIFFYADMPEGYVRTIKFDSEAVSFTSFIIGWILVGAAIIYWICRPPKQKFQ